MLKRLALTVSCLLWAGVVSAGLVTDDTVDSPLVRSANAWEVGEPIPNELLQFRQSGHLPLSTDTVAVFGSITNYALLREIIFSPCDQRIFDFGVARALSLVGPIRFFRDIGELYSRQPDLLSQQRHRALEARARRRHVVVDGLFIADQDMARAEADTVFRQITADLMSGGRFDAVQKKYWNAHEYAYTETFRDGTKMQLRRTRVGNYGDFVVSEDRHDAYPYRIVELPGEHVQPLLNAKQSAVVVLRDEREKMTVLYQIREVYSPIP